MLELWGCSLLHENQASAGEQFRHHQPQGNVTKLERPSSGLTRTYTVRIQAVELLKTAMALDLHLFKNPDRRQRMEGQRQATGGLNAPCLWGRSHPQLIHPQDTPLSKRQRGCKDSRDAPWP